MTSFMETLRLIQSRVITALAQATPQQKLLSSLVGFTAYLILASSLRFQRRRAIHKKYPYTSRESMKFMTNHDAWEIQKTILQMEFPFIVLKSLQFALFRVCPDVPSSPKHSNNLTFA